MTVQETTAGGALINHGGMVTKRCGITMRKKTLWNGEKIMVEQQQDESGMTQQNRGKITRRCETATKVCQRNCNKYVEPQ